MAFQSDRTYDGTMAGSGAGRNDTNRLEILAYSDYVCPWCYIGHLRIEPVNRRDAEAHFIPCDWRLNGSPDGSRQARRIAHSKMNTIYAVRNLLCHAADVATDNRTAIHECFLNHQR